MTLIGSKGGGGGTFKQRPDTLRSNDTFEALMGVGAGPMKGPTRGLKSVTINGTPVEDETGKLNFENFLVVFADGDPAKFPQIAELRLGAGAAPVGINVSLTNTSGGSTPGPWVTRTVPNVNADFIDLRFVVSQLYRQDKKGIYEAEANLHVEMKPSGSTNWINPMLANPSQQYSEQGFVDDVYRLYVPAANYDPSGYWAPEANNGYFKVFGKTNSPAVHELRITVPNQGAYANKSWDIRVRLIERDTLDADPNFEKRTISWESASAGYNTKYGAHEDWRGLAWLKIYGKATDQINSTPEVAVVCDTLIVPVPPASVFNPDTRQYTGALWDGSWTQAFTTDPAWVINGLIVDSLHGLSSVAVGSTLNKWDALEASKWCSQLVPDGAGGMHPRYSMNLSINETIDAREFVQYLAGAVGGIAWEDTGGEWRLRMDKPENPVDIFTLETIEGDFSYANTDVDTRFNDITIVFRNEEFDYREDRVRVVSNAHIAKYGRKPTTIVAVGCTNRQEALRRGMLRLRAATREVRSVTFRTNRRGRLLERLDTILVADSELNVLLDTEFNTRSTGRIVAVAPDRSWIEVRDPLRLELGVAYSINFTKPNPDYNPNATSEPTSPDYDKPTLVQTVGLVNNSSQRGDVVRLYLASPLPTDVAENANLSLVANGLPALPKAYRVLDIEEDGEFFTISAIELDTGKWAAADNVTEDDTVFIAPDAIVPPPTNLVSYISVFDGERTARQAINLNWDRPASRFLAGFKVDYAVNGGPWIPFAERTAINSLELVDPVPGNYQFRVYSVDRRGALSEPAYNNRNVDEIDPGALVGLDKIDVEDGLIWGGAEPLDMGRLDNRLQDWDEVNGDGKPEDNATYGAPGDSPLGDDDNARSVVEAMRQNSIMTAQVALENSTWRLEVDDILQVAPGVTIREVIDELGARVNNIDVWVQLRRSVDTEGNAEWSLTAQNSTGAITGVRNLLTGENLGKLSFVADILEAVDPNGGNPVRIFSYGLDNRLILENAYIKNLEVGVVKTGNIDLNQITEGPEWEANFAGATGDTLGASSTGVWAEFGHPGAKCSMTFDSLPVGSMVQIQMHFNAQRTGSDNDRVNFRLKRIGPTGTTYHPITYLAGAPNFPLVLTWLWRDSINVAGAYDYRIEYYRVVDRMSYFNCRAIAIAGKR